MHRQSFLLLLLAACASLVAAASAPTFCKCTCFTNSTIIEIKSTSKAPTSPVTGALLSEPAPDDDPPNDATSSSSSSPDQLSTNEPTSETPLPDDTITSPNTNNRRRRHLLAPSLSGPQHSHNNKRAAQPSPSCNQCNRAFCLAQSLPICKGAAEKDVVTMCFQRDSRKDQIIVWGFLLGTAGLLGWAAARKAWEMQEAAGGGGGLATVLSGGGGGNGRRTPGGGGGSGGSGVPVGRAGGGFVGSSGRDLGRGQYATVAGHSREGSEALT